MAPSRRELLQGLARLSGGLALAPVLAAMGAESAAAAESLSSELNVCRPLGDSLTALQQGNARFAAAWTAAAQGLTPAERMDLLQTQLDEHCLVDPDALKRGQAPWAAVLTCADSRIPLEWMFQAGAGELFAVRSAGNAVFNDGVASLEYAVAVLNVPLIMVLGHSDCGAVKAARGGDADLTPLLVELVTPIRASLQSGERHARLPARVLAVEEKSLGDAALLLLLLLLLLLVLPPQLGEMLRDAPLAVTNLCKQAGRDALPRGRPHIQRLRITPRGTADDKSRRHEQAEREDDRGAVLI